MGQGVLALATMALLGCGASPVLATYEGEEWMDSFMQVDFTRVFWVHVPERLEVGPAAPLVLAFHGVGQNAAGLRAVSGLDQAADEEGFIVVYLEAGMGAWDVFGGAAWLGLDDFAYVREVIDRVERRNVIDRNRIIAVGLSNGGVFSQQLGCKLAHRISGFVSVAASMPRLMIEECAPSHPVSALFLLGTRDPYFPVGGNPTAPAIDSAMQFWRGANGCSSRPSRSMLPDLTDDGTVVYRTRSSGCDEGTITELDSIVGGGHSWPGGAYPNSGSSGFASRDISANDEIIRLLRSIPRN